MMTTIKMTRDEAMGLTKGDIIQRGGEFVRVAKIERRPSEIWYDATTNTSGERPAYIAVTLAPSSERAYLSRPVIIPIAEYETRFGFAPCRKLPTGEWVQIKKIVRRRYEGAAGVGHVYSAECKVVSAAVAAKANAAYAAETAAKQKVIDARINADYI